MVKLEIYSNVSLYSSTLTLELAIYSFQCTNQSSFQVVNLELAIYCPCIQQPDLHGSTHGWLAELWASMTMEAALVSVATRVLKPVIAKLIVQLGNE